MPRQSRIDAPGALHHVIVRGIERRKIFIDDQDRLTFIDRLGTILEQTGTGCYAWALIPNHFHLLLKTGTAPLATVMRRLLTGHAVSFNHRHRRSGPLFKNRYKSILCQENPYFLELVRYIHLNPLRARLVTDMNALGRFPFGGHGVIMGKYTQPWQDIKIVLANFSKQIGPARRGYRWFVTKGIEQGRRSDLTGGGLIRSMGGWAAIKALRKNQVHVKSDERILGNGDFVEQILNESQESFERQYELKKKGVDIDYAADRVAHVLGIKKKQIWLPGKSQKKVIPRSLLCFWAVRELGVTMTAMGKRFNISTAAVSKSVERGSQIAEQGGYKLL